MLYLQIQKVDYQFSLLNKIQEIYYEQINKWKEQQEYISFVQRAFEERGTQMTKKIANGHFPSQKLICHYKTDHCSCILSKKFYIGDR